MDASKENVNKIEKQGPSLGKSDGSCQMTAENRQTTNVRLKNKQKTALG